MSPTRLPLPGRTPRPGVVWLLVLASIACAKEAPPPSAAAPPAPVAWAFDAPPAWDDRVSLADDATPGAYLSARVFLYTPRDTSIRPQGLLSIVVYDSASWARIAAEPGSPQGDSLASAAGQVFVVSLPPSNPFGATSADARIFDSLAVSLAVVRERFRVLR